MPLIALVIFSVLLVSAHADVRITEAAAVEAVGDSYRIELRLRADVPSAVLRAELLKFDSYAQLHPSIRASSILARHADVTRVQSLTTRCWFVFCFDLRQVLDYRVVGNTITATVVPGESDYRHGWLRWELSALGEAQAEVHFTAELEPDFWIPPLLGRWIIASEFEQVSVEITQAMIARSRGESIPGLTPSWSQDGEF